MDKLIQELIKPFLEENQGFGYRAGRFNPTRPAETLRDRGIGIGGEKAKIGLLGTGHYFFGSIEDASSHTQTSKQDNNPAKTGYSGLSQIDLSSYKLYRPNDVMFFYKLIKATTHYLNNLTSQTVKDPEVKQYIIKLAKGISKLLNIELEKVISIFKDYIKDIINKNKGDLLSNRLLANYDGIDLRGTSLDDFSVGSLIFNGKLKKGTYKEIQPIKEVGINKGELKKGIEVEKEHTDDPKIAIKIALDHLDEDPKYYTKLATLGLEEKISFKVDNFDKKEVESIEDFADIKMHPDIDIDLSSHHFLDRLNDPRNYPDIEPKELEDFFEKLTNKKEAFIEFLRKYKQIVAKDRETDINIPFMKMANKAIAKTIMRKRNFQTHNPILSLQELKGQSYNRETLEMSRVIVNQFKANYGDEYEGYDEGIVGETKYFIYYDLIPTSPEKLKGSMYDIDGWTDGEFIDINIKYNSKIPLNSYFNELIAELKEVLRHEFQHIGQFKGYSHIPPNTKLDGKPYYIYLTDPSEVEAHLKGLYRRAKTLKLPLKQVIDNFLDDHIEDFNSPKEIEQVKKVWDDWIKMNLPKINEIKINPIQPPPNKTLQPYIKALTDYMDDNGLTLKPYPEIEFVEDDKENASNIFGKTAYYMPTESKIILFTLNRHPKDILRSYAHELVHHHQNLNGVLSHIQTQNTNEDGNLENIEREAYEKGNILFRNWEDKIKKQ